MVKHKIRYTQSAIDDLDAIFDYIALEDQEAALKMLAKFEARVARLADMPNLGAAITSDEMEFVRAGYRYITASPYLIFYRVEASEICISRILHSRQEWLHLIFRSGTT